MANIDHLYDLYYDNLSGRVFQLDVSEIGSKGRITNTYYVRFQDYQADHLIGQDSNWHAEKVEAFQRMCYPSTWKMVGEYQDSHGVRLDADILVGGQNCFFAFRYDDELDDETYYPCSCILDDIRDCSYSPLWKIDSISEIE